MKTLISLCTVSIVMVLTACGGGGGGGAVGGSAVFLKDAPITTSDSRPADELNVEILKVELKNDGGGVTVFQAAPGSGISLNILALTFPTLLSLGEVPTGSYDKVEIQVNPANATIHFTDTSSTLPLVVTESGEGDEEAEFEFEFEPAFTVESGSVSNAVIDFAPIVTFDGSNYILAHDHLQDETGEVEDVEGDSSHGAEIDGRFLSLDGDLLKVSANGSDVQIDISSVTSFSISGSTASKSEFVGSLVSGDEIEAEGVFSGGVLSASKIQNQGSET